MRLIVTPGVDPGSSVYMVWIPDICSRKFRDDEEFVKFREVGEDAKTVFLQ